MAKLAAKLSQSTIKMEKGYYEGEGGSTKKNNTSQSTIKMEKGYYLMRKRKQQWLNVVAIHNKNGKGLLLMCLIIMQ